MSVCFRQRYPSYGVRQIVSQTKSSRFHLVFLPLLVSAGQISQQLDGFVLVRVDADAG